MHFTDSNFRLKDAAMKHYHHLTQESRYLIAAEKRTGKSHLQIASELGCSRQTIWREMQRNTGQRGYRPKQAQHQAVERRSQASLNRVRVTSFGLAHNRTLTDRGAFAVMIGANVGTTLIASTALLASTALDTVSRKLALLNTSFNVLGVLLFTTLLQPIIGMILTMNIVVASRFPLFTPHLIWQPLLSHSSFCRISGQHWTAGSIGSPEVASLKQNVCITINLKPESR